MTKQGTVSVHVSWRRIERWLATYAPADREQLNPPATREEIEAAELVDFGRLGRTHLDRFDRTQFGRSSDGWCGGEYGFGKAFWTHL